MSHSSLISDTNTPTKSTCRSQVTVSLSEDGGDELFCGYKRYSLGRNIWSKVKNFPTPLRLALSKVLDAIPTQAFNLAQYTLPSKFRINNASDKARKLSYLLEQDQFEEFYQSLISHNKTLKTCYFQT